ncbi:MAG: methionyl-tRNA [Desulfovibrionaceae bacterium]|nr:MAG: methionyl-tRNA [Desulfovibrionaceae bacterium]
MIDAQNTYIVAAVRDWNRRLFDETTPELTGSWHFAATPDELDTLLEKLPAPRAVFFPHWNAIIPERIHTLHECVGFHMTDLPFGRGGSPLQNLIARGIRSTMLSAIRITRELDAGPVYLKRPLNLEGAAEEIFIRASRLAFGMMREMIAGWPQPVPQEGHPEHFARRTPGMSRIEPTQDLETLFDHVRMLDAKGYPPAFLTHGGMRYEFSRAALRDGHITADVRITRAQEDES